MAVMVVVRLIIRKLGKDYKPEQRSVNMTTKLIITNEYQLLSLQNTSIHCVPSCWCVNSQGPVAVFLQKELGQLLKDRLAVQVDKLFPTDLTGRGRGRNGVYLKLIRSKHLTDKLPRLSCPLTRYKIERKE